ncbi:hypothetical protein GF342_00335 [Candidatus Woesearchaeota archaeon]|nr:hypothetical protein [Candidatus Woesearchaeota archaeon]
MCGRYAIVQQKNDLETFYDANMKAAWKPRYNAAPTQELPLVLDADPAHIVVARWGLIPFWAKDDKIGARLINARSETVAEKPTFRTSFKKRRCLIPATHFYEWKKTTSIKKPFAIHLKSKELFSFAGLWDEWKSSKGELIRTFTILTCGPNSVMKKIHDRMPVILKKSDEEAWMNPTSSETALQKLLKPFSSSQLVAYEISTLVNLPTNDNPAVVQPV